MSTTYVTNMDPLPEVHRLGGSMSLFPVFRFHTPFDYLTASCPYETYITYYTITQIIPDSTCNSYSTPRSAVSDLQSCTNPRARSARGRVTVNQIQRE